MKAKFCLLVILVALLALALPVPALAKEQVGDKYVFGDTYTLAAGETLDGNLIVFGGTAILEKDTHVTHDVIVFGGQVRIGGKIDGQVVGFGGLLHLGDDALVKGDVQTVGGSLDKADGAVVEGQINNVKGDATTLTMPNGVKLPNLNLGANPFFKMIWFMFRVFMWAALAVLVVLFLPKQSERIAEAAVHQPLISAGLGVLTAVVVPVLVAVLAITICLIPISLVLVFLLVISWVLGLVALGMELGKRLAIALKMDWAPALAAGLGTFGLMFVVNGIREIVPCVGWIVPAVAGMLGLGAVLLTRLGTQEYTPAALSPFPPPAATPPVMPEPPAAPGPDQEK